MKHTKFIIPLAILIILIALTAYRYYYGIWNPFMAPDRINVYGRRYHVSHIAPTVLTGPKKPTYPIYSVNLISGKMLYMNNPKGEFVPTVIYLYVGSGNYQTYELSGGP